MVFPEWEENVISVWRLEFDMVIMYCLLLSLQSLLPRERSLKYGANRSRSGGVS